MDAAERKINQILTEQNRYEIPPYQRPYSWETTHVEQLLDDLWGAYAGKAPDYFMGSLVVIERQKGVRYEVVDGQQRLTTLSMLLARLRDSMPTEAASAALAGRVMLVNALTEEEASPRLILREADRAFFQTHIAGRTPLTPDQRRELQRSGDTPKLRLMENLDAIDVFLAQRDPKSLKGFADYVLSKVSLLMLSTISFSSAYRLFNVLNARGLPLASADLIKTALFQRLPPRRAGSPELSAAWTRLESLVGLEKLDDFFVHHYASVNGRKPSGPLHEAYEPLIEAASGPQAFMEGLLATAATHIRLRADAQEEGAEPPALRSIKRVKFDDWRPLLLAYLRIAEPQMAEAEFFDRLERLTYQFWIRGTTHRRRAEVWGELLEALQAAAPAEGLRAIFRNHAKDEEMLARLSEDVYGRPYAKAALLRFEESSRNFAVMEDFDSEAISTIEHVLPQVLRETYWRERFSPREHAEWVNKLGNLTLLAGRKNSRAQTLPFPDKRRIYAERNARIAFDMTNRIIGAPDWSPAMVASRQRHLLEMARRVWGLDEAAANAFSQPAA